MTRKFVVAVATALSLGAFAGATSAAATPVRLSLSEYGAFAVLGHWCGGIKQQVYATGFASTGYPTGAELLSTSCSGSGRDGGGKSTTYKAWASSEWDWYGETRKFASSKAPEGISETFSAEDAFGDHLYNVGTAAYLEAPAPPAKAPAAPTGVTAYVSEVEVGEQVQLRFQVGWTPAAETAPLLTSSHIVATPVGSTAPVLEATVGGGGSSTLIAPLERRTTYRITVTNTDREGTSEPSTPVEVNSIGPEEAREQQQEEAEPHSPEFGRCVKAFHVKEGTTTYYYGGFTTAGCTERSATGTGKYEWEEGAVNGALTFPLKTAPVTLEAVDRSKVTCTGESGTGQVAGRKTVGEVVFTFTGCESSGVKCATSGLAAGEMRTTPLEGELGIVSIAEVLGKEVRHIGIDLFPAGRSGPVLEYACGSEEQTLSGSVIAPVVSNKMATSSALKFTQAAGLQKPEAFETGARDVLTTAFGEQRGLSLSTTLHSAEAIEINGSVEPLLN